MNKYISKHEQNRIDAIESAFGGEMEIEEKEEEEEKQRIEDNESEHGMICGACQTVIEPWTEIMVTMERFSHHERTWPACSPECAKILEEQ